MAIYPEVFLFPHVKLSADQLAALAAFFDQVSMLAPNGVADELPGNVRIITPEPAMMRELMNAYDGLKKFGDQVLSENTSVDDYRTFDIHKPPLYDREATLGILAEFQAGAQSNDETDRKRNELYRSVALTLLLSEDVASLQYQALNVLKDADEQSAYMWNELKGEPDPLRLQTRDIELDLMSNRFIKKRLTAWGILAKIHSIVANVYVTLDRATLEQCLEIFEPGAPFKETTVNGVKALFYLLPVSSRGFLNSLVKPDADFELLDNAQVILGYVN